MEVAGCRAVSGPFGFLRRSLMDVDPEGCASWSFIAQRFRIGRRRLTIQGEVEVEPELDVVTGKLAVFMRERSLVLFFCLNYSWPRVKQERVADSVRCLVHASRFVPERAGIFDCAPGSSLGE